jgi:hypothetical protein
VLEPTPTSITSRSSSRTCKVAAQPHIAFLFLLDELVRKKRYPNRAEAIRMAVRDFIRMEARLSVE